MKVVEKEGKNEEEAIKLALEELGAERNEVKVEYLEKSKSSFLGLGNNKLAKVRVYYLEKIGDKVIDILKDMINLMDLEAEFKIVEEEDDRIYIEIISNNSGILIGKHGKNIEAIQFLLNIIVNKNRERNIHVVLDIENYRDKRTTLLKSLANKALMKVKKTGKPFIFEPMNPFERRIIHMELKENNEVSTFSIGEGPLRKVKVVKKTEGSYDKESKK